MSKVLILLDADVTIHFLHAEKFTLLAALYPERLRILDVVVAELNNNRTINPYVDNLFTLKMVQEIRFPIKTNEDVFREFSSLKDKIDGRGERACLAFCRHTNNIIASSNTRDIAPYCTTHAIAYLTTLDIFCVAIHRGMITRTDVNALMRKITAKGSRLKCSTIEEYESKHFDSAKLSY